VPVLYLIRHPHTRLDPAVPSSAWGLSATGSAQVSALADAPFWPGVTAIYTSDQPKTTVVGKALRAAHGIPHRVVPNLREAARDTWLEPEVFQAAQRALFADPDVRPATGWESAQEAAIRFSAAMDRILTQHPAGESLAVVSHATVLTLYAAHLRGVPPDYDQWQQIGFAAVLAVDRATLRPLTDFVTAPYEGLPKNAVKPLALAMGI
jgi:broad specificity phosphatase PhoE